MRTVKYRQRSKRDKIKLRARQGTGGLHGSQRSDRSAGEPEDYSKFRFTASELVLNISLFSILCVLVSYLFYHSLLAFFILYPLLYFFLKERKKDMIRERKRTMSTQFLAGMKFVSTSLQAGYAAENAFREAYREVRRIYPEDSFVVKEFSRIVIQLSLNVPLETLLADLGRRTGVEEIRDFGEVFTAARRTGGDMISIVRNTVMGIERKEETMMEIETVLTGRQFEQRIMSLVPLGILGYVHLTSPEMISSMYGTSLGILVMTAALILYAAAFLWGKRIMTIEV